MNTPKEKVHNISLTLDEIEKFPQTYNTILQEERTSGTLQVILRRKLNRLCNDGDVYKTSIPGTRFGKAIFYCLPKKYYILVDGAERTGSEVYCFFKYTMQGKYYMRVEKCWKLEKGFWVEEEDLRIFFQGNVLKFI